MASDAGSRPTKLRLLVVGHAATLVADGYATGHYTDEYNPSEGPNICSKTIQNTKVYFEIQDMTWLGTYLEYRALFQAHLKQADCIISVVEPTRPESTEKLEQVRFGELKHLFEERKQLGQMEEGVIVLWREKEMSSMSRDTEEWKAGMARGQEFAERAGAIGPFPTHGQTGQGVEEAFEAFAIETLEMLRRKEEKAKVDPGAGAEREDGQKATQTKRRSVWGRLRDSAVKRKLPLRSE